MSDLLLEIIKADQSQDIYYSNKLYENQKKCKTKIRYVCLYNVHSKRLRFESEFQRIQQRCQMDFSEYVLDTRRNIVHTQWQMVK